MFKLNIASVQTALKTQMTAKACIQDLAAQGHLPDDVIAEASALIPQAYYELNDKAVKLLCNIIKAAC